ncbi:non-ribosomal peptide synthetase [Pseudoalteromonas luteoviolacea]|uniref:Carrier domain-containing protein n=1 Tax=Pseudoalteromonas luteoviolacea S4060-1 TaxID=1365257 RepID=A0A162CDS5_9GAMM|nr:non-ribosomal peptide synthetase [Pseudoalteromonas luteoviolacea]KZN66284.1 hypothetical protein N478_20425 [Pseudoalteromonas luteoviolacea S4060-1]
MATEAFLKKINTLGIKLWLEGSQLKFKAPKGTWNNEIRDELVANKAQVIAHLQAQLANQQNTDVPPITPVARAASDGTVSVDFPLSFSQERLWFIDQLESGSANYSIPIAVTICSAPDKPFNIDLIERAFNLIIDRHENLRSIFPSRNGKAHQQVLAHMPFKLESIPLTGLASEEARLQHVQSLCQTLAKAPFDLAHGPLIKAKIFELSPYKHVLVLNMHHIISDGWSMGILVKEFACIMDALQVGRTPVLPPLAFQYLDYSVWQRQWLEDKATSSNEQSMLQKQLTYWKNKLAGVPESLNLPTDFPRVNNSSVSGRRECFSIDKVLTQQLKAFADKQGCTLYMLLLAIFKVLLYRYSHQEDICIGTPVANRHYEGTESLIGLFINTLVLRDKLEGAQSFTALLAQVKQTCLEAFEHQDTPFEKIVDMVQPQRNASVSPLFQVMFVLQNTPNISLSEGMEAHPIEADISKFDMTLEFNEGEDGLGGSIEYRDTLFSAQTIVRLSKHFATLCQAVINKPATALNELEFMGTAEKEQLLTDFNNTHTVYAQDKCIHELFVTQVARHPEKTAVVFEGEALSYQALYDRSHTLAIYLQSLGVQQDSLVGLCMGRSLDMIVGMMGILLAGGAYVPMDPDYPQERLAHMLQDSQAKILLSEEKLVSKLRGFTAQNTQVVTIDKQWPEISDFVAAMQASHVTLAKTATPKNLAYVIYTSGSTGKAKGVAIEHFSTVALINWAQRVYSAEELSAVLASTSISFDLSVFEVFLTLASGGKVVLVSNILALIEDVHQYPVSLINTVPSAAEELIKSNALPSTVHTINLAGEPLTPTLVDKLYSNSTVKKVYDLYGPSEDTTYSTFALRVPGAPQTIGCPIDNTQMYILDQHDNLVPVGIPGELHIAGHGLARGYLNRAELTFEKFVPNPFQPDQCMYKTGDLVRWMPDGNIEYLGRIDTQVKIRGFRIEIGEIEARLNEHSEVTESIVVAQGEGSEQQLIAYYVAKEDQNGELKEPSSAALKRHIQTSLPDYMLPAAFVSLEAIPLMPNGKVNRRALEERRVSLTSNQAYIGPRNEVEEQLTVVWAEVLGLEPEKIGINDNFFELGGHSLLSTQVISKISDSLNIKVPLKALFSATTLVDVAEVCQAIRTQNEKPAVSDALNEVEFEEMSL